MESKTWTIKDYEKNNKLYSVEQSKTRDQKYLEINLNTNGLI